MSARPSNSVTAKVAWSTVSVNLVAAKYASTVNNQLVKSLTSPLKRGGFSGYGIDFVGAGVAAYVGYCTGCVLLVVAKVAVVVAAYYAAYNYYCYYNI